MRLLIAVSLLFASMTALPAQAEECSLDSGICGEVADAVFGVTAEAGAAAKDVANGAWGQVQESAGVVRECAAFEEGTACDQLGGAANDCVRGTNDVCSGAVEAAQQCADLAGPCAPAWEAVLFVGRCVFLNSGSPCTEAKHDLEDQVAACASGASGGPCAAAQETLDCLLRTVPCDPSGLGDVVTACLNDPDSVCDPVVACLIGDGLCEDAAAAAAGCLSHAPDSPCHLVWGPIDGSDPHGFVIACLNGAAGSPCDGTMQTVQDVQQAVFDCTVNDDPDSPCGIVRACLSGSAPACDTRCDDGDCPIDPVVEPVQECFDDPRCFPDVVGAVEECLESGPCDEVQECNDPGRTCDRTVQTAVGAVGTVVGIAMGAVDLAVKLALEVPGIAQRAVQNVIDEVEECFAWGPCANAVDRVIGIVEDL